jgi:hypothetical protein
MGTYFGDFDDKGRAGLWYADADAARTAVPHVISQSPGGVAWGYDGAGPSDAALSILTHITRNPDVAQRYHQEFKRDLLVHVSVNVPFQMDASIVAGWLRDRGVTVTAAPGIPDAARAAAMAEAWRRFDETVERWDYIDDPPWDRGDLIVAAVKEWMANFALDLHSNALDRYEADLDRRDGGTRSLGAAPGQSNAVEGPPWSSHVEVGWCSPYEVIDSWRAEQLWVELDATVAWLRAHGHPMSDRSQAVEEAVGTWCRRPPVHHREDPLRNRRQALDARRDAPLQRQLQLPTAAAAVAKRHPGVREQALARPLAPPKSSPPASPTARSHPGHELGL